LVVGAYELPKGVLIAFLGGPYERCFVNLKARLLGQRGGSATHGEHCFKYLSLLDGGGPER